MSGKRQLFQGVVNRIQLIGVEVEGGWDMPVKGHEIIRDGSVEFKRKKQEYEYDPRTMLKLPKGPPASPYPEFAIGEIVSPTMSVDDLEGWVRQVYPQHVNETCGLHIHMSFAHKLNYSRLMTPTYMEHMIEALKKFGEQENIPKKGAFWRRLDPSDEWTQRHCAHIYLGDSQALMNKKDYNSRGKSWSRYTAINYCEGQSTTHSPTGTVECRVLPMFGETYALTTPQDVELAVKALHTVITTTNRFLSRIRQREQRSTFFVPDKAMEPYIKELGIVVR